MVGRHSPSAAGNDHRNQWVDKGIRKGEDAINPVSIPGYHLVDHEPSLHPILSALGGEELYRYRRGSFAQ